MDQGFSHGDLMRNASIEELESGLEAAYGRVFALRAKLKQAKSTPEFRKIKIDLDHVVDDVLTIDGELQRRIHDKNTVPA